MRAASRIVAPLESTVHTIYPSAGRRAYVCQSCRARIQSRTAVSVPAATRYSRAFAATTSRPADISVEETAADTYVPADNSEGLEWIGSKEWLRARDTETIEFERFGEPSTARQSKEETLRLALRRAIFESIALDNAGIPVDERAGLLNAATDKTVSFRNIGVRRSSETGNAELIFHDPTIKRNFYNYLGLECPAPQDFRPVRVVAAAAGWKTLPFLADPEQKFAIAKRVVQLTGNALPDKTLSGSSTAKQVLAKLADQPKSQTVLEALAANTKLRNLNNITVYGKRQSRVDEDKKKGRWKVIVRELEDRELPVPGQR